MFRISPRLLVPPLVLLAITATACSADDQRFNSVDAIAPPGVSVVVGPRTFSDMDQPPISEEHVADWENSVMRDSPRTRSLTVQFGTRRFSGGLPPAVRR